jgi:cellulose synthase/poly-beta-1,6-N-acetylglucosamine synthase-like glycosyltransferase
MPSSSVQTKYLFIGLTATGNYTAATAMQQLGYRAYHFPLQLSQPFQRATWQQARAFSQSISSTVSQPVAPPGLEQQADASILGTIVNPIYRSQPLVSIIIPCYNAAPRLAQCLHSCLNQTHPNLEIILVNNNSTDVSVEIAQKIAASASHPINIVECLDPGANHARNRGFTDAKGEYIQWLDADDELDANKIA